MFPAVDFITSMVSCRPEVFVISVHMYLSFFPSVLPSVLPSFPPSLRFSFSPSFLYSFFHSFLPSLLHSFQSLLHPVLCQLVIDLLNCQVIYEYSLTELLIYSFLVKFICYGSMFVFFLIAFLCSFFFFFNLASLISHPLYLGLLLLSFFSSFSLLQFLLYLLFLLLSH